MPTATTRGRRGSWIALAALWTAVPAGAEPIVADSVLVWDQRLAAQDDVRVVPVEAGGDIPVTVDAAAFLAPDGHVRVDVYVAVPHVPLNWVRTGQSYRAEITVSGRVHSIEGATSRSFEVARELTASGFESTRRKGERTRVSLEVDTSFPPGLLEVEVADLRSSKNTLVGRLRGEKKSGMAAGFVRLPRTADPEGAALSGLAFGMKTMSTDDPSPDASGEARYGDVRFVPNPTRYYGKRQAVFPVYYEEYAGSDPADSSRVRYRVRDGGGRTILDSEVVYSAPRPRAGRIQRFDVSGFPTGSYEIVVELLSPDDTVASASVGQFHVFWSELVWQQSEQEVLDEARVLLSPVEFEEFQHWSVGRQIAYMRNLWESLDSTPGGANVARERFAARVRHAESRFGGLEGGKLSSRGRIHIRFGEPDAIEHVRVPTERDEMIEVLIEEFEGKLGYIIDDDDPRFGHFLRRAFNRKFNRNVAFEIWIYDGGGDPIIESQGGPRRGMAFIFVDENGVGIYELAYSSVLGIM